MGIEEIISTSLYTYIWKQSLKSTDWRDNKILNPPIIVRWLTSCVRCLAG